eukprot:1094708-Pyramimonas_sp.AAC.1
MHLPRTSRIAATAVAGQFARGIVDVSECPTQDQVADVGVKRFGQPPSWVRVISLVQVVTPS